ncbi:MAG: ActS/PrrB/RegB family redox-sensitive histidine kinase [Methyloligellaceae bacterium]
MHPIPPVDSQSGTSRLRLRTLIRLRWIAVIGQATAVFGVYYGLGFDLPLNTCLLVIALSAGLNVFLRIRYPASQQLRSIYVRLMLSYDLLQLSVLLYMTGGLQNPFSILLIVPVTVSASTQPPRYTLVLGAIAVAFATVLTFYSQPLPWYPGQSLELPLLFKIGVWSAIVCGTLFTSLYAWRIAKEARLMSDALAATEMVLARELQLSALDGLGAAAAHELGTPLSTISVIAKEMERDVPKESALEADVKLIRTQAKRCREILGTLTEHDGTTDQMFDRLPLTELIEEVVQPHRALGTEVALNAASAEGTSGDAGKEPVFLRNPGVLYGLGNIIENAIGYARTGVEISATWDANEVMVTIADDGPGIPPGVMEHLGEPYVTTRPATKGKGHSDNDRIGLGLGFFIAKTFLERSGAALKLKNLDDPNTGAVVRIIWPRDRVDLNLEEYAAAAE